MSKIRILMVDDEERFRTITAKILGRKGFETIVAESGERALEKLSESPDVVVLDVKMGGMDGHETLREIKKQHPDLPVIMLTGHGDVPSAEQALKEGAYDYLAKPCDIDLLTAKIQDALHFGQKAIRREKTVKDIMIPIESYTSITETSTVADAIAALQKVHSEMVVTDRLMDTRHRSLLIFTESGELVGILSPNDLIQATLPAYIFAPKPSMADSLQYSPMFWQGMFTSRVHEIMNLEVAEVMSEKPLQVDSTTNLMEAAHAMSTGHRRRVAVMEGGKIIGVIREQEVFYEIASIISNS
ncbi:response regulator [Desulfovibrio ferrophilus]|uniref:Response regulator receiver modulated CBS domain protein n=1 Tax=Desulfovibrio ferrophilus TaxID=241368 RepID=A0A2Z6AY30_9BACT|nr:response regulator [Desulfovibrio ferrophilus]BBD08161.1 response regulator receiver modulated CBS domain protein [Desulfovibrio ferrophilus]